MPIRRLALGLLICATTFSAVIAYGQEAIGYTELNLQGKVNALVQQLHLRYANDRRLEQKRGEVKAALDSWNEVQDPSPQDRQAMAAWLQLSLDSNMPGSSGRLPEIPRFFGQPSIQLRTKPLADGDTPELTKPAKRSEWSRHPAAAPLEWVDPFRDDEQQSEPSGLRSEAKPHRTFRQPIDASFIEVNRAELARRIHQYNESLRTTNLQVLVLDSIEVQVLESITEEIERLIADLQMINLYRANVPQDRLKFLPEAASTEMVEELVRRKVDFALKALSDVQDEERQAIERIAKRLARL